MVFVQEILGFNGRTGDDQLVKFLEMELSENSISVIEDAEKQLLDDTPEAYVQREMGVEKESRKKIALRDSKNLLGQKKCNRLFANFFDKAYIRVFEAENCGVHE